MGALIPIHRATPATRDQVWSLTQELSGQNPQLPWRGKQRVAGTTYSTSPLIVGVSFEMMANQQDRWDTLLTAFFQLKKRVWMGAAVLFYCISSCLLLHLLRRHVPESCGLFHFFVVDTFTPRAAADMGKASRHPSQTATRCAHTRRLARVAPAYLNGSLTASASPDRGTR